MNYETYTTGALMNEFSPINQPIKYNVMKANEAQELPQPINKSGELFEQIKENCDVSKDISESQKNICNFLKDIFGNDKE